LATIGGTALVWPSRTAAQVPTGLDAFAAAPPGDRFFGVQGPELCGRERSTPCPDFLPRLMFLVDYASRPVAAPATGASYGNAVGTLGLVRIGLGVSLWERLLISADTPIAAGVDSGNAADPTGRVFPSSHATAPGDLHAGIRARLLGEARSRSTLALAAYVLVPRSNDDDGYSAFSGDGQVQVMPAAIWSGEDDRWGYAVNLGVNLRRQHHVGPATALARPANASQVSFAGAAGMLLAGRRVQVGPEVYGDVTVLGPSRVQAASTNLAAILGVRVRLGSATLGAAAGPGIVRGMGTPALRVVANLAYAPAPDPPPVGEPPRPVLHDDDDDDDDGGPDAEEEEPDETPDVRVTATEIVIRQQIRFEFGSAVIAPTSDGLLGQVAAVLAEHLEIRKVDVEGHTDNVGGEAYNQQLSEARAASVVRWLVERGGSDPGRLTSHGYGLSRPLADNATDDGRRTNRRVQFKIVEVSDHAGTRSQYQNPDGERELPSAGTAGSTGR
jgi:OmpA-OmpF porin, OOP family